MVRKLCYAKFLRFEVRAKRVQLGPLFGISCLNQAQSRTCAKAAEPLLLLLSISLLLVFLTLLASPCLPQAADHWQIASEEARSVVGNGTPGPYQLKNRFILTGTEEVRRGGLVLDRDKDYVIDYNDGLITFSSPLSPADTLLVRYRKLNLSLRKKYFHRELVTQNNQPQSAQFGLSGARTGKGPGKGAWSLPPTSGSSDLSISGSKTFSLQVGSAQDLSLKQGLWLSAKGKATRDLEISLQVSDQNMPATPDGTTKRLEELDKVQILVQSPNFSGTLGDYYLRASTSQLFSYEKKLKGVMGEAKAGRTSASFALASSKGEYFTNRFLGEENKQGPYRLVGKAGQTNIMILPGTERVWVDGEEMQRGSNNDYTIDYTRGSIEFTSRRLITSHSRITVDFEYSVEDYQRDFYSGNFATGFWDGRAEFKATGILHEDNRNHPSSFSLSPEDKDILSRAGNDRLLASKDGATYVGVGMGDYELAYDSSGSSYYQYTESDSGSYTVSFSWVGEKRGSYKYAGAGIYQYVYPGNGDYMPVVLLPLPESHSLFDLGLSFSPHADLKTEIEWAGSKKDRNTFSSKDDERNWGDAFSFVSTYQNSDFDFLKPNFHKLELKGEYLVVKRDFAPFGRIDQVEKERKWDLPQGSTSSGEETYQFGGLVSPAKFLGVSFDFGQLTTQEDFTSHRRSTGLEVNPASWISGTGKAEKITTHRITLGHIRTNGEWAKDLVVITGNFKKVSATLSWEREQRKISTSGRVAEKDDFNQFGGKVSLGVARGIKTSSELFYREDDRFAEGEPDRSFSYTWRNRVSIRNYRGMLSSDLEFARRIKKYRRSSASNSRQDLLTGRIDFYPPSQLLNIKVYHSQNQVHSAQRVDTYVEVEEGKGDYWYENGGYVLRPEGNFIRLSEWVGEVRPSLDLNKSVRLIFSPHKVSARENEKSFWSQLGKVLSTDSFLNLRGVFLDKRGLGFFLFYPAGRLPGESILSQNITIRHDFYVLPASRPINFRLRWEKTEDSDNLVSDGGREEERVRQELLIRSRFSSTHSLESRVERERIESHWGNQGKDLIVGEKFKLELSRRESGTFEIKMSTEYRKREEQIRIIKAKFFSLSPELSWSPFSQSRFSSRFQWTHLWAVPPDKSLPYVLSEGRGRGENYDWRLFLDYRLNQYLTSSVIYSGESLSGKEAKHTARVEMKAFF